MSIAIYVVTRGQWDSYCTDMIFTNGAAALAYIAAQPEPKYEFERVNPRPEVWVAHDTADEGLAAQAARLTDGGSNE